MKFKADPLKMFAAIIAIAAVSWVIFSHKKTERNMPQKEETMRESSLSGLASSTNAEMTGEAKLSWNANKESNVAGYRIYYGTTIRKDSCPPGGYLEKVDTGNITTYKLDKLKNNSTYYFSITSYNRAGKESCFSGEVSKFVK